MNEPLDLGNQRHVDKRNKRLKTESARQDEAFRWLMADDRGRRFIAKQLREAEVLVPYVQPSTDRALFKEGLRAHGLALIQDITRICPQHLATVIALSQGTPEGENDDDGSR
jgi:hypothetical protein